VLKESINFYWKVTTLRRKLKEMDFKWKRCGSRRKILIERENIVNWRCSYLQKIRTFRETGKPLLYLDETWVDANLTYRKCWQNKEFEEITTNVNASNRLIVVAWADLAAFLKAVS
jgi:hypothetical protein